MEIDDVARKLHDIMIRRAIIQGIISPENAMFWDDDNEACREDWRLIALTASELFDRDKA